MKLLVLMGGTRILDNSNKYPLYLTELKGKLILEIVLERYLTSDINEKIFCIKQEEISSFNIDSIILNLIPDAKLVTIKGQTQGAVCTALLASEYIDNDEELLIVSIDDYIDIEIDKVIGSYRKNDTDCGIVCFSSVHPRYSFAKMDSDNVVCEITEKKPVSKNALASFYYFKKGTDFVFCAKNVIRKGNRINNRFYISQAINEMILLAKKIAVYKIQNEHFHSFKTEQQLAAYITSYKASKEDV